MTTPLIVAAQKTLARMAEVYSDKEGHVPWGCCPGCDDALRSVKPNTMKWPPCAQCALLNAVEIETGIEAATVAALALLDEVDE